MPLQFSTRIAHALTHIALAALSMGMISAGEDWWVGALFALGAVVNVYWAVGEIWGLRSTKVPSVLNND